MTGDEFDQYRRKGAQAGVPAPQDQAQAGDQADQSNQDEYAQYARQKTHAAFPSTAVTPETQAKLKHTQTGTGTEMLEHGPVTNSLPPFISGRAILNETVRPLIHPLTAPASSKDMEGWFPEPDYSKTVDIHGKPGPNLDVYQGLKDYAGSHEPKPFLGRFAAGSLTDTADLASGFTTPESLALLTAAGGTSLAPELSIVSKPLMGAAGLGYGIGGAKDIYDVTAGSERDRPLEERLRKGLMGGAQVAGGAAGLGETSLRGAFSRGMDVKLPNEAFTPRELYETAAKHGISLDLAETTNRPILRGTKVATMHGLVGSGPFEKALSRNIAAVNEWGDQTLDNFSQNTGEAAGARIQQALKNDYEMRKGNASAQFEDLDRRVGPNTIDGTLTVEGEAIKIRDAMKGYYDKHPELKPKQAWSIIEDLAERPKIGVKGKEVPAPAHTFSWSELHQLRSDLMDVYRNNPDLVKSRAESWLQQMVKTIDETMTDAGSQLTPADQAQFRAANQTWEDVKSTYDNPQHPLYHAVRNPFPSKVAGNLLSNRSPELARELEQRLGPDLDLLERETGIFGDLQRAAAEQILGQDRGGAGYDFKGMGGRMSKFGGAYLQDLLGPGSDELAKMARIGDKVLRDYNPSGTAKTGYKQAQLSALAGGGVAAALGHPLPLAATLGGLGIEGGVSRAMNSPRLTRLLTDTEGASAMPRGLLTAMPAGTENREMDARAGQLLNRINARARAEMAGP